MSDDKLVSYLESQVPEYLELLRRFVELESPSFEHKEASDRCAGFLEELFGGLGFRMKRLPQETCGDHVYGELGTGPKSVLFVGHYDTVYPVGTLETMPFRVDGGKAFGPGVLDMKGGIIMAYFAVKALQELNLMPDRTIGVFFNGDEETGSFHSSDLIIQAARQYRNVLVMEPGINDLHSVKTSRFGRGTYHLIAHGKAAHSGSNPHLAISPLMEIARQLLFLEQWDRELEDVTLAPTAISGGEPETCMIPETARLTMDVRYRTREVCQPVHRQIMELQAQMPGIRLEVRGKIDKPVMIADPALFRKAAELGRECGLELKGVPIGGGSDGNFTADAGVPTLDGLGTSGEFLHNPNEYIHIDHIARRTALTAKLLQAL